MWIGAQIYNILAGRLCDLPPSRWINKQEALLRFPHLLKDNLRVSVPCIRVYDDVHLNEDDLIFYLCLRVVCYIMMAR